LRHDVTRASDEWVYFYLVVLFTHHVCAPSLSRSLVAHTQPHTTLQLLAPHTLTHSWCDVKGVTENARAVRARAIGIAFSLSEVYTARGDRRAFSFAIW
jgi:hypothetical protein